MAGRRQQVRMGRRRCVCSAAFGRPSVPLAVRSTTSSTVGVLRSNKVWAHQGLQAWQGAFELQGGRRHGRAFVGGTPG